ncbi:MAG: hypothetical protein JOZ64_01425 [Solirubrobacterales bacterium]|nr:hypothetical protein [Solirubrobacterales bacterium]
MSTGAGSLRMLAFGELGTGTWGAALSLAGEAPFAGVGTASGAAAVPARLEGTRSGDDWRLTGEGVDLIATALAAPVAARRAGQETDGFDQLCRVSGRFDPVGAGHELSTLGCRSLRGDGVDVSRYGSLRAVTAWFEPGLGLALAALRPRRAKGQEADLVSAAVLDPDGAGAVEDPRLSTAYTAEGWPVRAGLELWVAGEDEQLQVRRAAGEATGGRVESAHDGLAVRAGLFRWHLGGQVGAGVYLLAGRG